MVSVMAMTPVHLLHHGASLTIIGFTISLHVLGMFAFSPVFGILADRIGRVPTILLGQVLLAAALVTASFGQESTVTVTVALFLLGLGWSATNVVGSTLLTEASSEAQRTRRQGLSDLTMSLVAAIGAILAGVILAWIGYGGLALVVGVAVIAHGRAGAVRSRTTRRAAAGGGLGRLSPSFSGVSDRAPPAASSTSSSSLKTWNATRARPARPEAMMPAVVSRARSQPSGSAHVTIALARCGAASPIRSRNAVAEPRRVIVQLARVERREQRERGLGADEGLPRGGDVEAPGIRRRGRRRRRSTTSTGRRRRTSPANSGGISAASSLRRP